MAQGIIGYSAPSRTSGFVLFNSLGTWLSAHVEIFILIACLLGYQVFAYQHTKQAASIVQSPQKSDFFFVDYFALNEDSSYTYRFIPMKVLAVNDNDVTFKVGNVAHSTPVSPRQHMKFDNAMRRNFYRENTLTLSKAKIAELFNSGVIYNARRPRNIFIDGWIVMPLSELNAQ
jgi:hypothetical protein